MCHQVKENLGMKCDSHCSLLESEVVMVSFENGALFKTSSSVIHSVLQHLFQYTLKLNSDTGAYCK